MRTRRMFHTIDTHTGGAPTRTVVGGIPVIPGTTMQEKMVYMMERQDWIRRVLTLEPRGNEVMSGTILTPPCNSDADMGVLYYEGGWMPMCGHDTIGVATALIESGMVDVVEPVTTLTLDTPSGIIKLRVEVENSVAKRVTFVNAPAFVLANDCTIDTKEFGSITLDVAYGGNIYAILPAEAVGLSLIPENSQAIVNAGNLIKDYVNAQVPVVHPEISFINKVTHVEFFEKSPNPVATLRNAVVVPPGAIDRSPCGTGTSAKMAVLAAKGKLAQGEEFVHESLIGSLFHCRIVGSANVAGIPAIVPEISGSAYVTGIHTFVIDPDDPFPEGFSLG